MDVEWAEEAKANLQKHGVSFADAEALLFDPHALNIEHTDIEGEQWWSTRITTKWFRLSSARKASRREREQ